MIRLSGSGNYTLWRIWDGITTTNGLSNSGVETSSKARDGWCGSQPMPTISFMPLSITLIAIHHRNPSLLKRTLPPGGGRHWLAAILKHNNVLIKVRTMLRLGDTLIPMIKMSDRTHLSNFAGDQKEWHVYTTICNLSSTIWHIPWTHTVVIVAHLPIPLKNRDTLQKQLDVQRQTN